MNEEVEEEEGEGDGSTFERERDFEGDGQRLQFLTRAEFWGSLRDLRKFLHVSVWGFQYFSKRNLFLCLTKNL